MVSKLFMRAPSSALSSLLFVLQILQALTQALNNTAPKTTPAFIVFGDSIVDPGNNNVLVTMGRCNFPPYGKDFAGHEATGRFSNGKIPSDFLGIVNCITTHSHLFTSELGLTDQSNIVLNFNILST